MPIDATPLDPTALPAVVAGPILRRLTRSKVTVWAALTVGAPVTLHVRRPGGADQSVQATPTQVGSNLWFTALTIGGIDAGEFQAGQEYEYWLESAGWGTRAPNWGDYAYAPRALPTFVGLPATLDQFTIYHISCRKVHGGGRDGLELADEGLRSTAEPRPNLLMLSGDQIYADDVP